MSRFAAAKASIVDQSYTGLLAALNHYDSKVDEGQKFLDSLDHHNQIFNPTLIADVQRKLPGYMSMYYQLAQEADGIKVFLEEHANVLKMKHFKRFTTAHSRELSDRTAERYAEVEPDYIMLRELIGETNLRKERLTGYTKGLASLDYQIKSVIELRKLGIEDATI